jgi:hypothetical protein
MNTPLQQNDRELWVRVGGEFRELPGLQLTLAQASRLWHTDRVTIERVLNRLVESAFLRRAGAYYVRADSARRCA